MNMDEEYVCDDCESYFELETGPDCPFCGQPMRLL